MCFDLVVRVVSLLSPAKLRSTWYEHLYPSERGSIWAKIRKTTP